MRLFAAVILSLAAAPALAGLDRGADPRACVARQIAANAPVAECVNAALTFCFSDAAGSVAGTACFLEAKDEWSAMIAERMAEVRAAAPEKIAAVAAIEAKYDVLLNLAQCDRMQELAALGDTPSEQIHWQDARCEATALGLAFVKLMLQSQDID